MKLSIVLFVLTFLFKRIGWIKLQHHKATRKLKTDHGVEIDVGTFRLKWSKIEIEDFIFRSKQVELACKKITAAVTLKSLWKRYNRLHNLEISGITISFYSYQEESKYNRSHSKLKYERLFKRLFRKLMRISDLIPHTANFDNIAINSPLGVVSSIGNCFMERELSMGGRCKLVVDDFKCNIDKLKPNGLSFKTIKLEYRIFDEKDDAKSFNINARIGELSIENPNLPGESEKHSLKVNIEGGINDEAFLVNPSSDLSFDGLVFAFFFQYNFKDERIKIKLNQEHCGLEDILNMFRSFINRGIYGIKSSGTLALSTELDFCISNPMDHIFDLSLEEENFKVTDIDSLNLEYLKGAFEHIIYKDDKVQRVINLERKNKLFKPLDNISAYLLHVIICTEDPGFAFHRGVDPFFVGYAMVTNIAERKFSRGGSTITMQLVRNLFLNHRKTIYRKAEEVILTLLLENVFKISKERIYEVYLNIIEFGPNIYGISEASEFYFNKQPADLTFTESLVISYIIPRPKHFLPALQDKSPILIRNLKNHIKFFSRAMLKKEIIGEQDIKNIEYEINFSPHLGKLVLSN